MGDAIRVRPFVLVALVFLLAVLAAAGALLLRARGDDETVIPAALSTYVEAVPGTWQRVNPLFASENPVDQDLVALLFNGLVRIGDHGVVEPDLAEALPAVGPDGRTYTFRLREGLRWHDGEPVTSSDVLFTIDQITAPGFRGPTETAAAWSEIVVDFVDDRTVEFTLPEPSAPFLARVAGTPILPRHLLEGLSPQQLEQAPFNSKPVGTGPYRVSSLSATEANLRANQSYHLGRPRIEQVRLRFFSDHTSALRAFQDGEVDGLFVAEPRAFGDAAIAVPDTNIVTSIRFRYDIIYLNNSQADLFRDGQVRRALSLALDRAEIVRDVYDGFATASASPVTPGSWAYFPEYDATALALNQAESLLDEAGWLRHSSTGIRTREGAEFRITIRTDDDPGRVALGRAIASQLDRVGIKATVASTTFTVLRRDFLQERLYEVAIVSWDQGADPDPYFGWHSSQLGAAGLNIANFTNGSADLLIEEARQSTDGEWRLEMYRQFQEIWETTAPSLVVAYPTYIYAFAAGVRPVIDETLQSPGARFSNIHLWTN
jgi:peptide/nickel transport system substrate-binding protein